MPPEIEPFWTAFFEIRSMFGADFDMRDVLGWLDLKGIESPSEREDYGYFAMRMKRAGERIAGA